jgi:hypothetical protein
VERAFERTSVTQRPRVADRLSPTTAWQDTNTRAQLSLIDGTLDGHANALGAWFDATHTRAGITQSFGAFRIDPNLAWEIS